MKSLEFWTTVLDELSSGEPVFVALVADHTRHSPGTRGAHIMLTRDGQIHGTIGGGIMEKNILEAGAQWLADGRRIGHVKRLYHRRDAPGATSGMICAGHQTNIELVVTPADALEHLERACASMKQDRAGVIEISTGGKFSFSERAPRAGERRVQLTGDANTAWVYEEQILELDRAVIFGGGHCGLALSDQLATLGYAVTVTETREDLLQFRQNESARYKLCRPDYADTAALVNHPELTLAVVMTADFPSDTRALEGALRQPFPFIGVMGAPAKLRAIKKELLQRGFGEDDLARLTAPVGLPIGSSTPQEIAVSVAAQLIQLRPTLFPERGPSDFAREEEAQA